MSTKNPKPVSSCPQCNAQLNAVVRLNLYDITVVDGILSHYDGGPEPDSDSAILDICEPDNTIIFCQAGHLLDPTTQINPLHTLELIAQWPANSNSEPDIMGQALEEITSLAHTALQHFAPQPRIPFQVGRAYNSKQTGDHYIFTGLINELYAFYRPSTGNGHRLTRQETETCFDYQEQRKTNPDDAQAASEWHNSTITI
jgi:hypothetical protein